MILEMPTRRSPITSALVILLVAGVTLATTVCASAQSARPGPGASLYDDDEGEGTTFRTWAPNALSVSVAGSFNGFNPDTHLLGSEGDGWW
ncbi:MAG: hypothetical protein P8I44_08265, partial [Phycisphaerales bacterium]|nr:hypothetical protein [Phycisphaerales bacterium]